MKTIRNIGTVCFFILFFAVSLLLSPVAIALAVLLGRDFNAEANALSLPSVEEC